jgi:hypothetical protein
VQTLPGAPIVAAALRGSSPPAPGGLPAGLSGLPVMPGLAPSTSPPAAAEGPSPAGGGAAGSIDGSLGQSQDMNLYYLRVQEEVNAQNRSFTAVSNVLKAQHDTVKTAIGNIR